MNLDNCAHADNRINETGLSYSSDFSKDPRTIKKAGNLS